MFIETKEGKRETSRLVRVKWEVEELIELASKELGLNTGTARSLAILYGLPHLFIERNPKNDDEFLALVKKVREWIERVEKVKI